MRTIRRQIPRLGLVGLLGVTVLAGCRQPEPRNLLLITIDTLRPDRLGLGGNERPVSPVLDRFAAEAVRFERSYSQSGWTLPSIATILTGRHPSAHGAVKVGRLIDPGVPTLAELLSERGYECHALVSHAILRSGYGLGRGFSSYDESVLDVGHPHKVATAEPLTDLALSTLDSVSSPFFLWVHYFDPHFAYLSHPEWAELGNAAIDRYDGEIAHTDRQIGRLLEGLARHPDHAATVVAITSDHGEAFGRFGRYHYSVREEVLRIPLLIRAPGLEPARHRYVAQQIDLLPTLLELLGLPPPEGLPGRDLLAAAAGGPAGAGEPPVYVERQRPKPFFQRVLIRGRHKLVVVEPREPATAQTLKKREGTTRVRPGIFLYDLAADPRETVNLWDESDPQALALLEELTRFGEGPSAAGEEVEVSEELREKLRALGYLE